MGGSDYTKVSNEDNDLDLNLSSKNKETEQPSNINNNNANNAAQNGAGPSPDYVYVSTPGVQQNIPQFSYVPVYATPAPVMVPQSGYPGAVHFNQQQQQQQQPMMSMSFPPAPVQPDLNMVAPRRSRCAPTPEEAALIEATRQTPFVAEPIQWVKNGFMAYKMNCKTYLPAFAVWHLLLALIIGIFHSIAFAFIGHHNGNHHHGRRQWETRDHPHDHPHPNPHGGHGHGHGGHHSMGSGRVFFFIIFAIIATLISFLVISPYVVSVTEATFAFIRGEKSTFSSLFVGFKRGYWRSLKGNMLPFVITKITGIFSIFLLPFLVLCPSLMIQKPFLRPAKALKVSWIAAWKQYRKFLGFVCFLFLINLISAVLTFGIALIVTLPATISACAFAYHGVFGVENAINDPFSYAKAQEEELLAQSRSANEATQRQREVNFQSNLRQAEQERAAEQVRAAEVARVVELERVRLMEVERVRMMEMARLAELERVERERRRVEAEAEQARIAEAYQQSVRVYQQQMAAHQLQMQAYQQQFLSNNNNHSAGNQFVSQQQAHLAQSQSGGTSGVVPTIVPPQQMHYQQQYQQPQQFQQSRQ